MALSLDAPMTWVCALINTCHDCLPRHRDTRTYWEWQGAGYPGTGWSVCGGNCMCQLIPEEMAVDVEPLRRVRHTETGLTVRAPSSLMQRSSDEEGLAQLHEQSLTTRRAFRLLGQQNATDKPRGRRSLPRAPEPPSPESSPRALPQNVARQVQGLSFDRGRPVQTRDGPRRVRYAQPTPEIWEAHRTNREALRERGITITRRDGEWVVNQWE